MGDSSELDEILQELTMEEQQIGDELAVGAIQEGAFVVRDTLAREEAKQVILDWHHKRVDKARLNEVQNAYEYWINGRKFISSYFRERIDALQKGKS